jgi:hypothetical protein
MQVHPHQSVEDQSSVGAPVVRHGIVKLLSIPPWRRWEQGEGRCRFFVIRLSLSFPLVFVSRLADHALEAVMRSDYEIGRPSPRAEDELLRGPRHRLRPVSSLAAKT